MTETRTVLLVDDERAFAETLAKRLRLRGFECVIAETGTAGLESHTQGVFLGVLLDLRLPDMPGGEVLRALKEREPGLPVIIITAHGTDRDEEECFDSGASGFLSKPVDIDEIVCRLNSIGRVR
jgi:DNA-binding response OmpR family regulator